MSDHSQLHFVADPEEIEMATSLDDAFGLVASAVEERAAVGRRSFAASLKPDLQRRTSGEFDEQVLGFRTFGDFLHGAAAAGKIRIAAPTGQLEALPVNNVVPMSLTTPQTKRSGSIRRDLWAAFVDWNPTIERVFDMRNGIAVVLDSARTPSDFPVSSWRAQPDLYRRIEPISRQRQLEWMGEFADHCQDEVVRRVLHAALADPTNPAGGFVRVLRSVPEQRVAWHRLQLERVAAYINDWASDEGLDVEIWVAPGTSRVDRPSRERTEPDSLAALRAALHNAIDRMSFADLLRIPVPTELWWTA